MRLITIEHLKSGLEAVKTFTLNYMREMMATVTAAIQDLDNRKSDKGHTHPAEDVAFEDGETMQEKLDNGTFDGAKGPTGPQGPQGISGDTWVPSVSLEGDLTWAKNASTVPQGVNIMGPKGATGDAWVPSVSEEGEITWTKVEDGDTSGAPDPGTTRVNIQGPQGERGPAGPNTVGGDTATDLSGLLVGENGMIREAVPGEDYVAPTGDIEGNADTATKLETPRDIQLTGDVTGRALFDGTADAVITASLEPTGAEPGTYGSPSIKPEQGASFAVPQITVDEKGRITKVINSSITLPRDVDTKYQTMTGASSNAPGTSGLVPAPEAGKQAAFLRGDGEWIIPTDTTYEESTGDEPGLMSPEDKAKLDNTNIAVGTCATAGDVAAKEITLTSSDSNWRLMPGALISILFTETNTAGHPTFNIAGSGAHLVWYNTETIKTDNLQYAGTAGRYCMYQFDGSYWVYISWSVDNSTNYVGAVELPLPPGQMAIVGTSEKYAREDHVHPFQVNIAGNSGTATALRTARTISLSGGVTGTPTMFDGTDNITIPVTAVDPELLSGPVPPEKGGSGRTDGKASGLIDPRDITLEGDINGSVSFDGTTNVTIEATLPDSGATAGTYGSSAASPAPGGSFNIPQVTVDEKGRVTGIVEQTITIPDDTKVTQTLSAENKAFPVLLSKGTATATETSLFGTGVTVNPSTNTVKAATFDGKATSSATADKLTNAPKITINGGATSAATTFDGSGDINITITQLDGSKMSGAVPVEQGGTGRTDGKAVGLATPHNIKLTGEVSGSASFDGTADCTITAKIEASHIQAADAAPSDQKRFWIDTANEKILKYHDGTSWVPVHAVWAP